MYKIEIFLSQRNRENQECYLEHVTIDCVLDEKKLVIGQRIRWGIDVLNVSSLVVRASDDEAGEYFPLDMVGAYLDLDLQHQRFTVEKIDPAIQSFSLAWQWLLQRLAQRNKVFNLHVYYCTNADEQSKGHNKIYMKVFSSTSVNFYYSGHLNHSVSDQWSYSTFSQFASLVTSPDALPTINQAFNTLDVLRRFLQMSSLAPIDVQRKPRLFPSTTNVADWFDQTFAQGQMKTVSRPASFGISETLQVQTVIEALRQAWPRQFLTPSGTRAVPNPDRQFAIPDALNCLRQLLTSFKRKLSLEECQQLITTSLNLLTYPVWGDFILTWLECGLDPNIRVRLNEHNPEKPLWYFAMSKGREDIRVINALIANQRAIPFAALDEQFRLNNSLGNSAFKLALDFQIHYYLSRISDSSFDFNKTDLQALMDQVKYLKDAQLIMHFFELAHLYSQRPNGQFLTYRLFRKACRHFEPTQVSYFAAGYYSYVLDRNLIDMDSAREQRFVTRYATPNVRLKFDFLIRHYKRNVVLPPENNVASVSAPASVSSATSPAAAAAASTTPSFSMPSRGRR